MSKTWHFKDVLDKDLTLYGRWEYLKLAVWSLIHESNTSKNESGEK